MKSYHSTSLLKSKTSRVWLTALSVIVIMLAILAIVTFWLVKSPLTPSKEKILAKIPFPMALVNGQFITTKDFFEKYALAQKLTASQGQAQDPQLEQFLYAKLIEEEEINQVAHNNGVWVTNKELDRLYEDYAKTNEAQGQGNFEDLIKSYGLTQDAYKQIMLKPDQLQIDLLVWYYGQKNLNQQAYQTLQDLQDKISSGADMGTLAKTYSEDSSSKSIGGDMGFVQVTDLLPELQEGVDTMKAGDLKIIPTRYGLHLIKLEEEDNNGSQGASRVHLRQIFVKPTSFETWYNNQVKDFKVKQIISI